MDLEKLTKSQIILLTLLVSFVTSIATGIVTVSLMEQAPPTITQTVNRVVERTVERVAPSTQTAAVAATAAPAPIVIREADAIAAAVERVSPSVVRLFVPGRDEAGRETRLFVGLAIVADAGGVLIADAGTPDGRLTALRPDNIEVPVTVIARPQGANMIRLQAATTTGETREPIAWRPLSFSSNVPSLGQTIFTLAGRTAPRVAQGIVTTAPDMKEDGSRIVETDIPGDAFAAGSPLFTTDGALIGVATRESRAAAGGGFLASSGVLLQNTGE